MTGPALPPSYGARQAQSLADILERISDVPLEAVVEQLQGGKDRRGSWAEAKQENADGAIAAAARLMAGRARKNDFVELLEYLADVSVRRPFFVFGQPDAAGYAALREGQNGLFYLIVALVAQGRNETPTVREAP